jgi:predicted NBD/HSP70 family sugar kinase
MLVGTNLKFTKAFNYRTVLETIRRYGPLSRAEAARRTELTAQTISNITRVLLEERLIREVGRSQEGRGAPATRLAIHPDGAFSIGLDLDKDHLTGVLVDFVGTVRQSLHHDLNFPSPPEALDLLESTARTLVQQQGLDVGQVWGVGVGIPGPLDISAGSVVTNLANPAAFPGWHNVPVADRLAERLQWPIALENNATAAAIGERWYGAGQHMDSFFYVFFGAGLGGGLVLHGHPHDGFTGNAGELGYIPLPATAEIDPFFAHTRPHLGLLFNLPRLYDRLQEAGATATHPDDLAALWQAQHPVLLNWLETGVRYLAPALLSIEYLLDPQAIFFGGRLPSPLLKALIQRLEGVLPTLRIEEKRASPPLLLATAGTEAAALGVATLPIYEALAPTPRTLLKSSNGITAAAGF